MKFETFEAQIEDIQEGDWVQLDLDVKFKEDIQKREAKRQEKMVLPDKKAKDGKMIPAALPVVLQVVFPKFVVGRVEEVLPDLLYLVEAYEDKGIAPVKRGFETREILGITKITKEQYEIARGTLVPLPK